MGGRRVLHLLGLVVIILCLAATGCSKKAKTATSDTASYGSTQSSSANQAGQPEPLDSTGDAGIMQGRTSGPMLPVYFEFDSANIEGEQVQRLETNADFLKKNPQVAIRIEGNCDPRGTQEYNLALGQRRAQSAKDYLSNLGVEASRMKAISFGEEKLLLFGQDEASWAQNRRDDFVIQK